MALSLTAAVGTTKATRVKNLEKDVTFVQALLKRTAFRLSDERYDPGTINGLIGSDPARSATVKAIVNFQKFHLQMKSPDAVVDKDRKAGNTLDTLIRIAFVVGDLDLRIQRTEQHSESIIGNLFLNNERLCYTLELPWRNNASNVSCAPSGTYTAFLRYTSKKRNREWCVQLKDVPNRTAIQIHMGERPSHIQGCTLVGMSKSNNFVGSSEEAYTLLQDRIFGEGFTRAQIRAAAPPHGKINVRYAYNMGLRWNLRPGDRIA